MSFFAFKNVFDRAEHFVISVRAHNSIAAVGKYAIFIASRAGISISHLVDLDDVKAMRDECDRAIKEMERPIE